MAADDAAHDHDERMDRHINRALTVLQQTQDPSTIKWIVLETITESQDIGTVRRTTFLTEKDIKREEIGILADNFFEHMYNNCKDPDMQKEAEEIIDEHKMMSLAMLQMLSSRGGYFYSGLTAQTVKFEDKGIPIIQNAQKKGFLKRQGSKFTD